MAIHIDTQGSTSSSSLSSDSFTSIMKDLSNALNGQADMFGSDLHIYINNNMNPEVAEVLKPLFEPEVAYTTNDIEVALLTLKSKKQTSTKADEDVYFEILKDTKAKKQLKKDTSLIPNNNVDSLTEYNTEWGIDAQKGVEQLSSTILNTAQGKELKKVDMSIHNLVNVLKGYDANPSGETKTGMFVGFFSKVKKDVESYLSQYDNVKSQVDQAVKILEDHKVVLLTQIEYFNKLQTQVKDSIAKLDDYIGQATTKKAELENTSDSQSSSAISDLNRQIEFISKKIETLQLTRHLAWTKIPKLKIMQANNISLVEQINSAINTTIPLWKEQLVDIIMAERTRVAARSLEHLKNFTDEMIVKNAQTFQDATESTLTQAQRGIVDIEAIKQANKTLLKTIKNSLQIAQEGQRKRDTTLEELKNEKNKLQNQLREISDTSSDSRISIRQ
jgi:uncharacterized protein YaaN involved in tellurite resistance